MRTPMMALALLLTAGTACDGNNGGDDSSTTDGGSDGGGSDGGTSDGGTNDGGTGDGGTGDGGTSDGGTGDGGSDGGTGDGGDTGGGPCGEAGICTLVVEQPEVSCSEHEPPGWLIASSPAPGSLVVDHDHVQEGCCPDFSALAIANLRNMEIEVEYSLENDTCDCSCQLDLDYGLSEIPSGSYTLVAAGRRTKVEVE